MGMAWRVMDHTALGQKFVDPAGRKSSYDEKLFVIAKTAIAVLLHVLTPTHDSGIPHYPAPR